MRHIFLYNPPSKIKFNCCYKIAGSNYQSNIQISDLKFIQKKIKTAPITPTFSSNKFIDYFKEAKNIPLIYANNTLIGEHNYLLEVSFNKWGYWVKIDNAHYHINRQGIYMLDGVVNPTILLGPVLILNLALRKIFCLHASAFILNKTTFVLMADSGTGKSTIAEFMDQKSLGQRIADDIVCLQIKNNTPTLLSGFPQLKLNQVKQYLGININQNIVLLFAEKTNQETQVSPLTGLNVLKKTICHTIAGKLFSQQCLENHLEFCHTMSQSTPSYHVKYAQNANGLNTLYNGLYEIS